MLQEKSPGSVPEQNATDLGNTREAVFVKSIGRFLGEKIEKHPVITTGVVLVVGFLAFAGYKFNESRQPEPQQRISVDTTTCNGESDRTGEISAQVEENGQVLTFGTGMDGTTPQITITADRDGTISDAKPADGLEVPEEQVGTTSIRVIDPHEAGTQDNETVMGIRFDKIAGELVATIPCE